MYRTGNGVPKDSAEAAKWYRKAAVRGHAEAQYNLGVMYAEGEGVPKDDTEAEDIKERIEKATKSIGAIVEVDWEDFDLPGYEPDAEVILTELLNALYLRVEVKGLRRTKAMAAEPIRPAERPEVAAPFRPGNGEGEKNKSQPISPS